ncbi:hemicentin-1-like [Planococcus citri]|uniref:hemicentin-1-like n=1 Tax=Planococcus citri TaxID=170843 RepID=UPI0031F9FDEE
MRPLRILLFCVFLILYCKECSTKIRLRLTPHVRHTHNTPKPDKLDETSRFLSSLCSANGHEMISPPFLEGHTPDVSISSTTSIRNLYDVLEGLKNSPPYSAIYAITFATASWDESLVESFLEQIQIKRSQVNFFIQGEYPSEVDYYLKEYRLITSISNGITWTSSKLNPFTDCKSLRLNFIPTKAHLLTVYGTGNGTYCMTIDSLLKTDIEAMIFSSFDSNEYNITLSIKPKRTNLVNVKGKGTESRMQTITISEVCVKVRRKSQNSGYDSFYAIRGFSESDFDFDYGFSKDNVTSLDDTYLRPVKGISNKIYVSTCFKNTPNGFDHFNIVFLNGSTFGEEMPLEQIPNTDLFVGSFDPPIKEYFYIRVTTYADGETISRMSFIAMNAADGFGEDKQNPTFIPKPICDNPQSSESENEFVKFVLVCVIVYLLMALFFFWPKRFCRQSPECSEASS